MSGKGITSYRKSNSSDSRFNMFGTRDLVFAHKANAGDTYIDFTNLTQPDFATWGITNPSSDTIINARLYNNRTKVDIATSENADLIEKDYEINNNGITLKGWVTVQDEVIVVRARNLMSVASSLTTARPIYKTLVPNTGTTELDFVTAVIIDSNSAMIHPLLVFKNETPIYPVTNNNPANTDGDYYIKDLGKGYGRSIVLLTPTVQGDQFLITSNGSLIDRPQDGYLADLQTIQGQLDVALPDLALATGNDLSKYQTAPSSVDLAYFGNLVTNILNLDVPIITDWVTYAPVFGGYSVQPTAYVCKWRRVGADIEIDIRLISGTVDGTTFTIPLPSGLSLAYFASRPVGEFITESSTVAYQRGPVFSSPSLSTTSLLLFPGDNTWGSSTGLTGSNTGGGRIAIKAKTTISGWSATQKMRTSLGV